MMLVEIFWVYLMREKGEVASIPNFVIMMKNLFKKNVKIIVPQ